MDSRICIARTEQVADGIVLEVESFHDDRTRRVEPLLLARVRRQVISIANLISIGFGQQNLTARRVVLMLLGLSELVGLSHDAIEAVVSPLRSIVVRIGQRKPIAGQIVEHRRPVLESIDHQYRAIERIVDSLSFMSQWVSDQDQIPSQIVLLGRDETRRVGLGQRVIEHIVSPTRLEPFAVSNRKQIADGIILVNDRASIWRSAGDDSAKQIVLDLDIVDRIHSVRFQEPIILLRLLSTGGLCLDRGPVQRIVVDSIRIGEGVGCRESIAISVVLACGLARDVCGADESGLRIISEV